MAGSCSAEIGHAKQVSQKLLLVQWWEGGINHLGPCPRGMLTHLWVVLAQLAQAQAQPLEQEAMTRGGEGHLG
jgi:hypothetical protein